MDGRVVLCVCGGGFEGVQGEKALVAMRRSPGEVCKYVQCRKWCVVVEFGDTHGRWM